MKNIYEERADKAEAARDEARRKYKQAENYIEKMDAVIDDFNIAVSCINPLEDLKRATLALQERAEKAEASLNETNTALRQMQERYENAKGERDFAVSEMNMTEVALAEKDTK